MPAIYRALSAAILLTLTAVLGSAVLQRRLTYIPSTVRLSPAAAGLKDVREETLVTTDGQRLEAWYVPAQPGRPTVLYFHGNGGGLAQRADRLSGLTATGLGFYIINYRGYGASTGLPSEEANDADALTAYDHLRGLGLAAADIVLYGESLGTNVAARVALARPARGLVLEAPYTSIVDIGVARYPWLPVRWAMIDRYNTLAIAPRLRLPVLVLHGKLDQIVPYPMGERIYAAVSAPKRMITFPDGGHADLWRLGGIEDVASWIDTLPATAVASQHSR